MARSKSKVSRLPEEARSLIGDLLKSGRTIDEIMDKLRELDLPGDAMPSRSGLGRWAKQHGAIVEEMQRQAQIGEALVAQYGEAGDSRAARLNIAMAQGLLTRLMFTEDGQVATLDAKEAMFLASAIKSLTGASKDDTDRELKIRADAEKKAKAEAARAVEAVSRSAGLSGDLINRLKAGVFGKDAV
jgi:hypothetical protein